MKSLLIISNRLPFKLEKKGGRTELKETDGGLVTAIKSLPGRLEKDTPVKIKWIGCAGFKEKDWNEHKAFFEKQPVQIHPVFLNKRLEKGFYHGFSNSVIWPLFHYFPSFVEFSAQHYACYEAVNKLFAEVISAVAGEEDIIWIHDYHFMLLPGYLRSVGMSNRLGFFLHIPFPSYELFRLLPKEWRETILKNLMESNLVGFQTRDYANHFRETVQKCMHPASSMEDDWEQKIKSYPISVDFDRFDAAFSNKHIAHGRSALKETYRNRKIIFSVDRLDYTKGVMNRLHAYEELLEQNPGYAGKISFILNVVPSRDEISKYRERKKMIEENIGRINGKFGSVSWQPVIYQYRQLTFNQLLCFYTSCDVALVTPLRDGMNLVAKEFVASRRDEQGVLVLSDMAGAAGALKGAVTVTPTDISRMKECIIQALEMKEQEQRERMRSMRAEVRKNNVFQWASRFLKDLSQPKAKVNYDGKIFVV